MNCQSCSARIDYRFETNCTYCGSQIKASGVAQINPFTEVQVANSSGWARSVINVSYTLATSTAGMISGVVTGYCLFVVAYQLFLRSIDNAYRGCGPEMLVGMLSVCAGAFLGTVGGAVFAVKRPLCKGAAT